MAFNHKTVTIGATATALTSTHTPIQWLFILNENGNSAIYIGGSTVSATDYGHTMAADATVAIGTGTQGFPMNLEEVYVAGTADDKVHIMYIT